ncbi:MucB/RseB C-terminal domain-containing protein [Motilimonas pumila]|nr:MucB/RseB C-terminal domain-containing protein [Motilimonas pumila]
MKATKQLIAIVALCALPFSSFAESEADTSASADPTSASLQTLANNVTPSPAQDEQSQAMEEAKLSNVEDESPVAFLQKMIDSFATLNYDLSYIQLYEGLVEPKRFSHGVVDGKQISYLSHLNGPPKEYVQRGEHISFFEPEIEPYTLKSGHFQGNFFQLVQQDISKLTVNYDFVLAGRGRIAGRPAQVVRMSPRDNDRYGYLLWLDRNTSLPLRVDTLDLEGELVEQMMTISLRTYKQATPWIQELTIVNLPPIVNVPKPSSEQLSPWQISWQPKGFELIAQDRHSLPVIDESVDYLMLSDGVAIISIYIEPAVGQPRDLMPVARKGATNLITAQIKGSMITVVGEIPAETALKIAKSVTYKRAQ